MSKLIATYSAGFFACFTESRTGMQQRALIDIGDAQPTPQEMAELAGVLSDQWGWMKVLPPAPVKVKKGELTAPQVERKRKQRDNHSDPRPEVRMEMTAEYLKAHPDSTVKEIVAGLGLEPDQYRLGRWSLSISMMQTAGLIVGRMHTYREPGKSPMNVKRYSLTGEK